MQSEPSYAPGKPGNRISNPRFEVNARVPIGRISGGRRIPVLSGITANEAPLIETARGRQDPMSLRLPACILLLLGMFSLFCLSSEERHTAEDHAIRTLMEDFLAHSLVRADRLSLHPAMGRTVGRDIPENFHERHLFWQRFMIFDENEPGPVYSEEDPEQAYIVEPPSGHTLRWIDEKNVEYDVEYTTVSHYDLRACRALAPVRRTITEIWRIRKTADGWRVLRKRQSNILMTRAGAARYRARWRRYYCLSPNAVSVGAADEKPFDLSAPQVNLTVYAPPRASGVFQPRLTGIFVFAADRRDFFALELDQDLNMRIELEAGQARDFTLNLAPYRERLPLAPDACLEVLLQSGGEPYLSRCRPVQN